MLQSTSSRNQWPHLEPNIHFHSCPESQVLARVMFVGCENGTQTIHLDSIRPCRTAENHAPRYYRERLYSSESREAHSAECALRASANSSLVLDQYADYQRDPLNFDNPFEIELLEKSNAVERSVNNLKREKL